MGEQLAELMDAPVLVNYEGFSKEISNLHCLEWMNKISLPVWLYSCAQRCNVWANNAATTYFGIPMDDFLERDLFKEAKGKPDFEKLNNQLLQFETKISQDDSLDGTSKIFLPHKSKEKMFPGFPGVPPTDCYELIKLLYSPINMQGKQEAAAYTLCQVIPSFEAGVLEDKHENLERLVVMHTYNPIFTFLFSKTGELLIATPKAIMSYKTSLNKTDIRLEDIFERGIWERPILKKNIMETAYKEVFEKEETFRTVMQMRNSQNNLKYIEVEMYPVIDPVTNDPAVLVRMSNITQSQKVVDSLQAQREQIEAEKNNLEAQNNKLQSRLDNILRAKKTQLDTETPLEKIINYLESLLEGKKVDIDEVEQLRDIMLQADHLGHPTQLKQQMLSTTQFEEDVAVNLLQLVGEDVSQKSNSVQINSGRAVQDKILQNSSNRKSKELVPKAFLDKAEQLLAKFQPWKFNAFQLNEATESHPLSTLGFFLLNQTGVAQEFNLDLGKLSKFLWRIEEGYPDNPYHNRVHASDVLHNLYTIMTQGGIFTRQSSKIVVFAAIISAIIHDFEHGGVNNDYLVRSGDVLAMRYNDRSPLENHHLAGAFQIMRHPECNFASSLKAENWVSFRRLVIDMVMATDMKQHFTILSQFQAKLRPKEGRSSSGSIKNFSIMEDEHQSLILQMAIKCSDIGHICTQRDLHQQWVTKLEEEFFRQGDQERLHGLTISPLMDRRKNGITKSQVGFFDIVALPLFRAFAQAFPDSSPLLHGAEDNFDMWKTLESQATQ